MSLLLWPVPSHFHSIIVCYLLAVRDQILIQSFIPSEQLGNLWCRLHSLYSMFILIKRLILVIYIYVHFVCAVQELYCMLKPEAFYAKWKPLKLDYLNIAIGKPPWSRSRAQGIGSWGRWCESLLCDPHIFHAPLVLIRTPASSSQAWWISVVGACNIFDVR